MKTVNKQPASGALPAHTTAASSGAGKAGTRALPAGTGLRRTLSPCQHSQQQQSWPSAAPWAALRTQHLLTARLKAFQRRRESHAQEPFCSRCPRAVRTASPQSAACRPHGCWLCLSLLPVPLTLLLFPSCSRHGQFFPCTDAEQSSYFHSVCKQCVRSHFSSQLSRAGLVIP